MILTNKQVKPLIFGAVDFPEENGWLTPYRFTPEQRESFRDTDVFYERAYETAGIGLRLKTDSPSIAFDYRLAYIVNRWSLDIFVDGVPYHRVSFDNLPDEGHICVDLPEGEKLVTVNFNSYTQLMLRNVEINGSFAPARRRTKVLWLGDSITQGACATLPGMCYVNLTADAMGWDVVNQGIGGLQYDSRHLTPIPGWKPAKILVSLGTNGSGSQDFVKRAENFFESLTKLYPGVPVAATLPVWREDPILHANNLANAKKVCAIAAAYPNVQIIDGMKLIPNLSEFIADGTHPNDIGMVYYAANLVKELRRLKF